MSESPRVAVVGARRARQGLGPFLIRMLGRHGVEVPAFIATSEETRDATARQLRQELDLDAQGFLDLDPLLDAVPIDGLVILSPVGHHRPYLERALEAGLHVLCEKPLLWNRDWEDGADLTETSRRIVGGFEERGLLLHENCQWPYTLDAFRLLHPDALNGPAPEAFQMRLTPAFAGERMIPDAAPHPLSLLQALCPHEDARVTDVEVSARGEPAEEMTLRFRYVGGEASVAVVLELLRGDVLPREASYSIDGHLARREVRAEDYAIFFTDGERRVAASDPMDGLVRDFATALKRLQNGTSAVVNSAQSLSRATTIQQRMAMLDTLARAVGKRST